MKGILLLLLAYAVINLGLIAVGFGIGFLLHRMSPSVDLGTSILIGVVSAGFSIHYFLRLIWFFEFYEPPRSEGYGELPADWFYPQRSGRSGRKRKRKEP